VERFEIETLLTLADELHFGRTAARLHVSTARVSQTVRVLERRIGAPLFDRTSRRVEVTAVGRRLIEELRPMWDGVERAVDRSIQHARQVAGELAVAFSGPAAAQLVVEAASAVRKRLPGFVVRLREGEPSQVLRWLRDGDVDVALSPLPLPQPGVESGPVVVREARMLAVPATHPLAGRSVVSFEEFARVPVLGEAEASGSEQSAAPLTAGSMHEALTLVAAGEGMLQVGAHVRRYYPRPDLAYVPIAGAPLIEWRLFWRRQGDGSGVRVFCRATSELVEGVA